ncbi:MAG: DUF4236 domain-containing protein [Eubacterium sp.]
MGLRFRKSVKLSKHSKINFNKDSVSLSVGTKGMHYTVNSNGRTTKSVGIPGTGVYYSESSSNNKSAAEQPVSNGKQTPYLNTKGLNPIAYFIITFLLGYLGVHHFIDGKIGKGILYLCTVGIFGIGWIVDCIISFIALFNKPASQEQTPFEPAVDTPVNNSPQKVNVGKMSSVTFGGYQSQSGHYLNYNLYSVNGVNHSTGRKITKKYNAKDETALRNILDKNGIDEPYKIEVIKCMPPTEAQFNFADNIGIEYPSDISQEDIHYMLNRFEYNDVGASQELADYADSIGVFFSAYVGMNDLISLILNHSDFDRCVFYAYAVDMSLKGRELGNMKKEQKYQSYCAFANYALNNEKILKSVKDRDVSDYYTPHKGTTAYKEVINFI